MVLHKDRDDEAPFKMKAKLDGECAECETEISKGDWMVYNPKEYKSYCLDCGEELL